MGVRDAESWPGPDNIRALPWLGDSSTPDNALRWEGLLIRTGVWGTVLGDSETGAPTIFIAALEAGIMNSPILQTRRLKHSTQSHREQVAEPSAYLQRV